MFKTSDNGVIISKTEEKVEKFNEHLFAYVKVGNLWDPEEEERMISEAEMALFTPSEHKSSRAKSALAIEINS